MRVQAANYGRQSRGKKKSISDQLELGHRVCAEHDWDERVYSDSVSASRYGRKPRGGWAELLGDLRVGLIDVLVLWEMSRGTRQAEEWLSLFRECSERGILIHIVQDQRSYDPRLQRDWKTLAGAAIDADAETQQLSERVQRGVQRAAEVGAPAAGPCPFGYVRRYDRHGDLVGQEICPETGPIVREIILAVGSGVALTEMSRRLEAREVPPPGARSHKLPSKRWYRERIREISLNPVYAGLRRHQAKGEHRGKGRATTFKGTWPALVTPAEHRAAVQVLTAKDRIEHGRKVAHPGMQHYLLTGLAVDPAGHRMVSWKAGTMLRCAKGCVQIPMAPVDELVQAAIVEALATPELYQKLRKANEATSAQVAEAEAEVAVLEARLESFRDSAFRGETTPATLARAEQALAPQIEQARQRAEQAGLPPALTDFLEPGADVEARWSAATLIAKRDVIRAIARVVIKPSPKRGQRGPIEERVDVLPA